MGEWAVLAQVAQYVFMILIAITGYFIKRSLARQDQFNAELEEKLDAILIQVNRTNGRVIALEEWKKNHTKGVDELHKDLKSSLSDLWSRLNSFIDGHNGR